MFECNGLFFTDRLGRSRLLKGINLSGAAKLPSFPALPSHQLDKFYETDRTALWEGHFLCKRQMSILPASSIGQVLLLTFQGFNFLRFNITWEAIEHEGPGIYDMEYVEYIVAILKKAKRFDFKLFLDPHQDVWSRFSGGSGAPSWTFKFAGLDITKFAGCGSAIIHNLHPDPENFPKMIWPTNYYKLACATMFSLFFAGKELAPKCIIRDKGVEMNIQDFLQNHYLQAICVLARRINQEIGLEDEVMGYDTLNEPHHGYIGLPDITLIPTSQELRNGCTPTALQSMILGSGTPCFVDLYRVGAFGPIRSGEELIDPRGAVVWLKEKPVECDVAAVMHTGRCLWAEHGVWDPTTGKALIKDYFSRSRSGQVYDFSRDFFTPFVERFTRSIRMIHKQAIIFIEPAVNEPPPHWNKENDSTSRMAFAPHFYDGLTLMKKSFNSWFNIDYLNAKRGKYIHYMTSIKFGLSGINKAFTNQLETIKKEGRDNLGNIPCVIGEIGIPFDMDEKIAFKNSDYSSQTAAMNANMSALEATLLNFTLWNYVPENCHTWGDGWNGEDLSIFCSDERRRFAESELLKLKHAQLEPSQSPISPTMRFELSDHPPVLPVTGTETTKSANTSESTVVSVTRASEVLLDWTDDQINAGGRVLSAIVRAFPIATPGVPVRLHFDMEGGYMVYTYEHNPITRTRQVDALDNIKCVNGEGVVSFTDPPTEDEIGQWCEIFLPRLHFPSLDQVNVCVANGDGLEDVSCNSGEWIVNTEMQRLWFRCCCYSGGKIGGGKRSSIVHPNIRHTLVVRRGREGEGGIREFACRVIRENAARGYTCGDCSIL